MSSEKRQDTFKIGNRSIQLSDRGNGSFLVQVSHKLDDASALHIRTILDRILTKKKYAFEGRAPSHHVTEYNNGATMFGEIQQIITYDALKEALTEITQRLPTEELLQADIKNQHLKTIAPNDQNDAKAVYDGLKAINAHRTNIQAIVAKTIQKFVEDNPKLLTEDMQNRLAEDLITAIDTQLSSMPPAIARAIIQAKQNQQQWKR